MEPKMGKEMESALAIRSVVLGVRYEPQYRVGDFLGTLVDSILHATGTPFNPDVFPISNASPVSQELFHPEIQNALKITQSDTLLDFVLPTTDLRKIVNLGRDFQNYVLGPLHKICGVGKIMRFGMLIRFDERGVQDLERPTIRYSDPDLPAPRDFGVRFSHRLPTIEGYFRKNVNDYRNLIYTFNENSEARVSLSLDYQEYFNPLLEASEWAAHSLPTFIDEGLLYHRTTFATWVKKISKTGKAA